MRNLHIVQNEPPNDYNTYKLISLTKKIFKYSLVSLLVIGLAVALNVCFVFFEASKQPDEYLTTEFFKSAISEELGKFVKNIDFKAAINVELNNFVKNIDFKTPINEELNNFVKNIDLKTAINGELNNFVKSEEFKKVIIDIYNELFK